MHRYRGPVVRGINIEKLNNGAVKTTIKNDIKLRLFNHCLDYVEKHLEIIQHAIDEAQLAVHEETKNTAGDRYETERAMKQRETELFAKRLDDALNLRRSLQMIDPSRIYATVIQGALVSTSIGFFFIAISTDEVIIDNEEYCVISIDSPIGQAMLNKKAGESFFFRDKTISINEII